MRRRVSPGRCLAASLPQELPGVAGVNPAAAACGGGARFLREAYAWRSVPAEAQQYPQRARGPVVRVLSPPAAMGHPG